MLFDVVPGEEAFAGFGHPAVVTVAAVLVVSRGLQNSGAVDVLAHWLSRAGSTYTRQIAATTGLAAGLSAFMNNVGVLAVLMPTAIRVASNAGNSPSAVLMPLAFASLLGGLVTLVGTPPNIVIATFRADASGEAFAMFDFAPVGLGVALAGLAFIALVGWRLIPQREVAPSGDLFEISDYLFEVRVPEGSRTHGQSIAELGAASGAEFVAAAIARKAIAGSLCPRASRCCARATCSSSKRAATRWRRSSPTPAWRQAARASARCRSSARAMSSSPRPW